MSALQSTTEKEKMNLEGVLSKAGDDTEKIRLKRLRTSEMLRRHRLIGKIAQEL